METAINKRDFKKYVCVLLCVILGFGCIGPCIAYADNISDTTLKNADSSTAELQYYGYDGYEYISVGAVTHLLSGSTFAFTPQASGFYRIESLCFINNSDPNISWNGNYYDDYNGLDFCIDEYLIAGKTYLGTVNSFSDDDIIIRISAIDITPVMVSDGNASDGNVIGGRVTDGNTSEVTLPAGSYTNDSNYGIRVLENHNCEITDMYVTSGNIEIPSKIFGYTVVGLSDDLRLTNGIIKIKIPDTVLYLNPNSFMECITLEYIDMNEDNNDFSRYHSIDGILFSHDDAELLVFPCNYSGDVYIPFNTQTINENTFEYARHISGFEVHPYNDHFKTDSSGQYLYSSDGEKLVKSSEIIGTATQILDSVKTLGAYSFANLTDLTNVNIPQSVTTIEYGSFSNCGSLKEAELPNSIESIKGFAFENCSSLESIDLKNAVTVDKFAFNNCSLIESVSIPNSIQTLGECSFNNCSSLVSVCFNGNVPNKGYGIFSNCVKLSDVTLKQTEISNGMFYNCSSLMNIDLTGCEIIGSTSFDSSGLTSVDIPDTVTSVGSCAFRQCNKLTSVTVGCNAIFGYGVFEDNINLVNVNIKDGFNGFNENDFYGCEKLESLDLPVSVTRISYKGLADCENLANINAPGLESLGGHSLDGTAWLENQENGDVYFNDTLYSFKNTNHEYDKQSYNVSESGYIDQAALWNTVTSGNTPYNNVSDGNVYWSEDSLEHPYRLVVKDGTKYIADYAFCDEPNLVMLTLPDGLLSIGEYAFANGGLKAVYIPSSVTKIGDGAFLRYDDDFMIYCSAGSVAQIFAENNNIPYKTTVVSETGLSKIDYENKLLYTNSTGINDVAELLNTDVNALLLPVASNDINGVKFYGTGSKVFVYLDGSIIDSYTVIVNGDFNGDSASDVFDVFLVEIFINTGELPTDEQTYAVGSSPEEGINISSYQYLVNTVLNR